MRWNSWVPGFSPKDRRTLGSVYRLMPGCAAASIPEVVRRYENPDSANALPGAITLERHDALHILLGRGIGCQDEGFVVGFTMGAAITVSAEDINRLAHVAAKEYPPPFRWTSNDVTAFKLGFSHSQTYQEITRDLHEFPFEQNWGLPISALRKKLGIDPGDLCRTYSCERRAIPTSWVSARLPRTHMSKVSLNDVRS